MAVNTYVSIITLNDSELNTPIKRQSKRQDKRKIKPPTLGQRTQTESEGMEKGISCKQK